MIIVTILLFPYQRKLTRLTCILGRPHPGAIRPPSILVIITRHHQEHQHQHQQLLMDRIRILMMHLLNMMQEPLVQQGIGASRDHRSLTRKFVSCMESRFPTHGTRFIPQINENRPVIWTTYLLVFKTSSVCLMLQICIALNYRDINPNISFLRLESSPMTPQSFSHNHIKESMNRIDSCYSCGLKKENCSVL